MHSRGLLDTVRSIGNTVEDSQPDGRLDWCLVSDSIFQINSSDAMLQSLIKRTSGAIPYLRATVQVASTSSVKAPAQSGINAVSSGNQASGQVNPNTGLQNVGNVFPFYVQGKFGFVATPTTITLYWDGTNGSLPFVVKRVDGTSFSVPQGIIDNQRPQCRNNLRLSAL